MGTHSKWYTAIRNTDVASVGGKNASLGEMIATLSGAGVAVPDGFAIAAQAYWDLLEANGIKAQLVACMDRLDRKVLSNLKEVADEARALLLGAEWPQELEQNIRSAYRGLAAVGITSVAVHSSAAAKDLPAASFAGRHESFLNISGEDALLEVCRPCYASLFGKRAIKYRQDMGFPDMKVCALRCGRGRCDLHPGAESGFRNVVDVVACWCLGENVVQGAVGPDEYQVFKPTLRDGKHAILQHKLGA